MSKEQAVKIRVKRSLDVKAAIERRSKEPVKDGGFEVRPLNPGFFLLEEMRRATNRVKTRTAVRKKLEGRA